MVSSPPRSAPTSAQPFDSVAAEYDAAFTNQRLGQWLRDIVRERLANAFQPGQHVLELGCGTGEDAIWLAQRGVRVTATDASSRMLAETQRKATAAGVETWVNIAKLDMNSLPRRGDGRSLAQFHAHSLDQGEAAAIAPTRGLGELFDGAFSNFGPLNCVEDRRELFDTLAGCIRPGGKLILVVMGPVCPWEIVWFLGHRQPNAARRRFRAGAEARIGNSTVHVWYPSHRRLQCELEPAFRTLEVAGIGLLLPPSDMGGLVDRAPRFAERLAWIDERMARTLPWRWLNDHYLLVMERR